MHLQAYAEFHDLLPHIRFGCRVLKVVEEKERSKGAPGAGGQGDPWSSVLGAGVRWRAVFRDLESRKHLQVRGGCMSTQTGVEQRIMVLLEGRRVGIQGLSSERDGLHRCSQVRDKPVRSPKIVQRGCEGGGWALRGGTLTGLGWAGAAGG
jgi:hypothetical protein